MLPKTPKESEEGRFGKTGWGPVFLAASRQESNQKNGPLSKTGGAGFLTGLRIDKGKTNLKYTRLLFIDAETPSVHVSALNPETGEIYWELPWDVRGGGSITMPRKLDDYLFLGTFFNGSLMLKLDQDAPGAEKLWQSPKITTKDTIYLH